MASVSGSARKAAKKGGDWDSLVIRKAANGFEVQKCFDYRGNGKMPPTPKPYLGTQPGETLAYIEQCLGKGEHGAHEAAEAKGKY